jgi:hypothetical protein
MNASQPTRLRFHSDFKVVNRMPVPFNREEVEREPMLFQADADFAFKNGGPITRDFLNRLPARFQNEPLIIDSRVHMLMPGWYPCIPGWHLDDIPRSRPDGQPDHVNPEYVAEHAMMITSDVSQTAFAVGDFTLEDLPIGGGVIYGEWHKNLDQLIADRKVFVKLAQPYDIIIFNNESFHRGSAATKDGWRFFIRATRGAKRPPTNKVRRQVQTYLSAVDGGW